MVPIGSNIKNAPALTGALKGVNMVVLTQQVIEVYNV